MKLSFERSLLALPLLLVPLSAKAHQDDYPKDPERTRAPTYDPSEFRSEQNFAFELRFGPYRPRVDDEFGGAATPFLDTFGAGESVSLGLEFDWQAIRVPHFGSIGPAIGWSWVNYSGKAAFATRAGRSEQDTSVWFMPMYGVAVLRVDVLAHDLSIPLVPYAKLGGQLVFWESNDIAGVSMASGVNGRDLSFGFQQQLGLMLHLNAIAPQSSLDMDNATGINHAYAFGEWLNVVPLGTGLNASASTWVVGLALEF